MVILADQITSFIIVIVLLVFSYHHLPLSAQSSSLFVCFDFHFIFRAALRHVRLCRTHASAICDQKVKFWSINLAIYKPSIQHLANKTCAFCVLPIAKNYIFDHLVRNLAIQQSNDPVLLIKSELQNVSSFTRKKSHLYEGIRVG